MIDTPITLTSRSQQRQVTLAAYIDPEDEERAHAAEYAWIKGLRHAMVDAAAFRDRFTVRDDSLWWFSELYLHKERVVFELHRAIPALHRLVERERPDTLTCGGPLALEHAAAHVMARHGRAARPPRAAAWQSRLLRLDLHARRLMLLGDVAPDRFRTLPQVRRHPAIAAFVHRAFWKGETADGSAEAYIGPVLERLETALGAGAVQYVGIGPATNFRSRQRWREQGSGPESVVPIERFAGRSALRTSRTMWRSRYRNFRALASSPDFRAAASIEGVDCWPVIREQLAGITWLQWPWSVRAMDEAAAALDVLSPGAVLTYAEAGGWGRALILEARRRRIPSAGLQHGFIYRTWLNYRHEADEMSEDAHAGFPRPTKTMVFDEYAAAHLRNAGRFPPGAIEITGSPRLDALRETIASLPADAIHDVRRQAGVPDGGTLVLVTTKEREARRVLPSLIEAAAAVPGVVLVIKPHPAETRASYESAAAGQPHVRVLEPSAPLAPLLAAARAVVTVNSTVALDAGHLGVPALVIGLPNNLSPFVETGALAGASGAELPATLQLILYDERFREQLASRCRDLLRQGPSQVPGEAAVRTARAVEDLLTTAGADRDQRAI